MFGDKIALGHCTPQRRSINALSICPSSVAKSAFGLGCFGFVAHCVRPVKSSGLEPRDREVTSTSAAVAASQARS
jgi:hypothetical protein